MENWLSKEINYFEKIKDECNVIFDVGASYSPYLNYEKEVHYFDPQPSAIDLLKTQTNRNTKSVFNKFGLSDEDVNLPFYQPGDFVYTGHTKLGDFDLKIGRDYLIKHEIEKVDFLKIDVEGYELKVLTGFGDMLNIFKYIQFEYGEVWQTVGYCLLDVVNYLKLHGFDDFYTIDTDTPLNTFTDNWKLCNIICKNKNI